MSNPRGDEPIAVPAHDDASRYRFEMIFDGGSRRVYADSWTELVEALIGDYGSARNETADEMRLLYSLRAQVELQARLCATYAGATLNHDETQVLMSDRHTPPAVGLWRSAVPLVLVTTYYQPQGNLDRPIGRPPRGEPDSNLIWIDPSDEQTFITSLADAGIATVAETNP